MKKIKNPKVSDLCVQILKWLAILIIVAISVFPIALIASPILVPMFGTSSIAVAGVISQAALLLWIPYILAVVITCNLVEL